MSYQNQNNPPEVAIILAADSKPMRLANVLGMTPEYVQLVKDVTAPKSTEEEFCLFLQVVHDTGLNPLTKEIWFYKMYDGVAGREMPVIHASIQGMRKAAEKIGGYCPGRQTEYAFDQGGGLVSATAHVKRKIDGDWQEVAFTADWDEFAKYKTDNKTPSGKWATMPKHMLGKCAEFNCLKRAFPTLETLANTESLPTDNFNAAFPVNINRFGRTEEEQVDENYERNRRYLIDHLGTMGEILLEEPQQEKLSTWAEAANLGDLKAKHSSALVQFTQYARGVYEAIPDAGRAEALESFNVKAYDDLGFDELTRFVFTYQKPIENQEHPANVPPPASPPKETGPGKPRPRRAAKDAKP